LKAAQLLRAFTPQSDWIFVYGPTQAPIKIVNKNAFCKIDSILSMDCIPFSSNIVLIALIKIGEVEAPCLLVQEKVKSLQQYPTYIPFL
jgi:hypothetical protein